ncbi:unnamed protein product [Brassicogethes aeneus]|uniref:Cytokine-inducible SH2-containing protein n=1 Tax=Brassicogethes aeneus TaxID=1431903 RepID=A0A9P0BI64_BRAAE|nr:unnamed protein product [Brassicogethes aeneus]
MLGCSTVCPNCQHEFPCCPAQQEPQCCANRTNPMFAQLGALAQHPAFAQLQAQLQAQQISNMMRTPLPSLLAAQQRSNLSFNMNLNLPLSLPGSGCASPQVSPSAPLSFIIPSIAGAPLQLTKPPVIVKPEIELQRLSIIVEELRLSGFYYEGISFEQANALLKDSEVGTFLVRNSSDPRFLFSLSVQTDKGPTSVRLYYINGYFRLDAQQHLQAVMPMFPSVVELVQHYVAQSKVSNNAQVWVDPEGKWYSSIILEKPLIHKAEPCSLKHLARVAVHKALKKSIKPKLTILPEPHNQLDLPSSLKKYLSEYPYFL